MNLSAIHNEVSKHVQRDPVVCDIGGYEFVSYSQLLTNGTVSTGVVCDIGGYEFVSYSQLLSGILQHRFVVCDIGGYEFVSYSQQIRDCFI